MLLYFPGKLKTKCRPHKFLLIRQKSTYCLTVIFPSVLTFIFFQLQVKFEFLRLCPSAIGAVITTQLSADVYSVTVGQTLQSILRFPLHSLLRRILSLNQSKQDRDCAGAAKMTTLSYMDILRWYGLLLHLNEIQPSLESLVTPQVRLNICFETVISVPVIAKQIYPS